MMIIKNRKYIALFSALLFLASCTEDKVKLNDYTIDDSCEVIPEETLVNIGPIYSNDIITNAQSLSDALNFDYSERVSGSLPSVAGADTSLVFVDLAVTDKSLQTIFVSGDVPDGKRIGAVFVQLSGTSEYFGIPVISTNVTGDIEGLPLEIKMSGPFPIEGTDPEPDLIQNQIISDLEVRALLVDESAPAPDVTMDLSLYSDSDWLIPSATPTMTAENVGGGGIQVTLFWNQENDIDLWLIEPDGNKIYYAAKNSVAGDGYLDFDNVIAYGPENIYFTDNIPDGTYKVQVHYFSGSPVTNWSISVTACGSTAAFSGALDASGDVDDVFTFDVYEGCVLHIPTPKLPPTPGLFDQAALCDAVKPE